jgi:hypothetical protein
MGFTSGENRDFRLIEMRVTTADFTSIHANHDIVVVLERYLMPYTVE